MTSWVPQWRMRELARPNSQRAGHLPRPVLPALLEEFHDKPYAHASRGELFPMPTGPQTTTTTAGGLTIPPPPWADMDAGEVQAALSRINAEQGDQLTPVDRLKLADGGYSPPPWRPNEPPTRPLIPWKPPKPRWREEEQ